MSQSVIKKNTYLVSIGQFVQMVLAFFLMFFAARYLGDEGFGKYAIATTIMYFVFLANDLGINIYITREAAKFRADAASYFSKALGVKLFFIPANLLLLGIFLLVVPYQNDTKWAIFIFGFYGILTSNVQLVTSIFRAFQLMKYDTFVIVLEKVLTTGLGILVLVKGWGLLPFCGVFVFGGMLSMIWSGVILKRKFFKFGLKIDYAFGKTLLITAIPFGLSMLLASVYNNLGIIILSLFESSKVVGWFSSSLRLVTFTNVIPTVLTIALFPAISIEAIRSKEKLQELYSRGFKYLVYIAIPMIVGTMLLADKIILLVFGDQFIQSIVVLRILIWSGGIVFFNTYFAWFFNATNNQKKLVLILIGAVVLSTILNFILILKLSYVGASLATVSTEFTIFCVCYIFSHQKIAKLQEIAFLFKSILASAGMGGFLFLIPGIHVLFSIVAAGLVYIVLLYLFKGFTFQEILLIRKSQSTLTQSDI